MGTSSGHGPRCPSASTHPIDHIYTCSGLSWFQVRHAETATAFFALLDEHPAGIVIAASLQLVGEHLCAATG